MKTDLLDQVKSLSPTVSINKLIDWLEKVHDCTEAVAADKLVGYSEEAAKTNLIHVRNAIGYLQDAHGELDQLEEDFLYGN